MKETNLLECMKMKIIRHPKDKELEKVYGLYKYIFALPEGRESLNGFRKALSQNKNKELLRKFGKFEEAWICCEENNKVMGAINFSAYKMPSALAKKYEIDATTQIIYLFVRRAYTKSGIGSKLVKLAEKYSKKFGKKVLYLCDETNPAKTSKRQSSKDAKHSGINENERIRWWKHKGFSKLRFNYIQPPLFSGDKPCSEFILNVKADGRKSIPSDILLAHLTGFFEISVLKGKDVCSDKSYNQQKKYLLSHKNVRILKK